MYKWAPTNLCLGYEKDQSNIVGFVACDCDSTGSQ